MTVFRSLSAPKSYLRQIHAERWDEPRWWLGDGADGAAGAGRAWIWRSGWEPRRVDNLGGALPAAGRGVLPRGRRAAARSPRLRYFAEKFLLDPVLLDLTTEIFPGARELILVRDFRDRLSSVFAWNEKRGEHGFGHDAEMSQAEYLVERVSGRRRRPAEPPAPPG